MAEVKHERWLPVPGWPGYEVSDLGNVRSYWQGLGGHQTGSRLVDTPHLLRPTVLHGYLLVGLKAVGRPGVLRRIHRLVLEAFVGPCPPGMEACHNNGKRDDNRPENLRWDTHRGNHSDRARHGTTNGGEKSSNAKLTAAEVMEIRRLKAKEGLGSKRLSRRFKVSSHCIRQILNGQTW